MQYDKNKTACFTGRRPKDLYPSVPYAETQRPVYSQMVRNISDYIEQLYLNKDINIWISGGAQGFDQLAFWAVHHLKQKYTDIKNIVFVPFDGQDNKWSKTGLFSQTEYQQMLRAADAVHICDTALDVKTAPFSQIAKALFARNEQMCDASSIIVGQYPDDSWKNPATKSGTAGCLRYAESQGLNLHVHDFRPEV